MLYEVGVREAAACYAAECALSEVAGVTKTISDVPDVANETVGCPAGAEIPLLRCGLSLLWRCWQCIISAGAAVQRAVV